MRDETFSGEEQGRVPIGIATIHSTCTHDMSDTVTSNVTQYSMCTYTQTHVRGVQRFEVHGTYNHVKNPKGYRKTDTPYMRMCAHTRDNTCTQVWQVHFVFTNPSSPLHNPQEIGFMFQCRYRCTISCLALKKHGVMTGRNCVGNKCIISVWEGRLIISLHA